MLKLCIAVTCASLIAASTVQAHGDVHERIEKLTQKFAQHPTDEILVRRARLYLEEGHAEAARSDLIKALEFAPDRYESFYYLAQSYLMLKRHSEAAQAAEQFIAKADNDSARARGLTLQGDILMAAAKPLEAANVYMAALARTPEPDPEHYIKAADAFHAAGKSDALEVLAEGIAKLGPLATLEERALAIEIDTRRYEAALNRIEQMLAANRRGAFLHHKKGQVLATLNRSQESEQAFRAALAEIEGLPPQRRGTRAIQELEAAARKELEE